MTSWLVKAAAQGVMSVLPGRNHLNHLFQEHVTHSMALTESGFDLKLGQCCRHLQNYRRIMKQEAPSLALELGTGWYPIVPVGLALAGAAHIVTIDTTSLLSVERTEQALDFYATRWQSGRLREQLPGVCAERVDTLMGLVAERGSAGGAEDLLGRLGVRVLVGDARLCPLAQGCVDLFVSNNTLEHIPPQVLREIMIEFGRLAAPSAVMDHFVDLSDHYAHFDSKITPFNYLHYADPVWWLFNNRLQYQSRLRASDYRTIMEEAGFRITAEEREYGDAGELARTQLARRFQPYRTEDLLVLRTWLTALARSTATAPNAPSPLTDGSATTHHRKH